MTLRTILFPALLAGALLLGALAAAFGNPSPDFRPATELGAYAEVVTAVRQNDIMTVRVEFRTDDPDYPGETLYEAIPYDEVVRRVYLEAGDRNFEVLRNAGAVHMPDALHLSANNSDQPGAVVGIWDAVFEAPDHDLREIYLFLPNTQRIGPFPIRNR